MHQVSKRTSGSPFAKSKGRIETVCFHPTKPLFFVATQRHVRDVYQSQPSSAAAGVVLHKRSLLQDHVLRACHAHASAVAVGAAVLHAHASHVYTRRLP